MALKPVSPERVEEIRKEIERNEEKKRIEQNPIAGIDFRTITKSANLIYRDSYAKGFHELQRTAKDPHPKHTLENIPKHKLSGGKEVFRPIKFKENILLRVEQFKMYKPNGDLLPLTSDEKKKLFLYNTWLDSCCGILYKKKSTKFKINTLCDELMNLKEDFNQQYFHVNYKNFEGTALDSGSGRYKYDNWLSYDEAIEHEAWLTALEEDKKLLKEYADIIFKSYGTDKAMAFYIRYNTDNDELRALFVSFIDSYSNAYGSDYRNVNARFFRVAHK